MSFESTDFFNKNITTPLYKNNSKFSTWEDNKNKYKEEVYNKDQKTKHKEEYSEKDYNRPIIYSDDYDCKSVEDYGEFVRIIVKTPDYTITKILYTTPQEDYTRYIPPTPFLGKYSSLYYEPDEITDDLLGCFVGW